MRHGIFVFVGMALLSSPVAAQDPPTGSAAKPLPREIVAAWENAGAETGWMWEGPLALLFQTEAPAGKAFRVPAFHFGDAWRAGRVAKLPAPGAPFGLSFDNMTDAALKELAGMTSLKMLDLRATLVTGVGLKELGSLKNLHSLKLGYRVTGKGVKEAARLQSLKAVYLSGGSISDAQIKELVTLKNLQRLSLHSTRVTDRGLKELSALQHLQTLDLFNTKITDVGLKELANQPGLQMLRLTGTGVTEKGVQELRKSLPNCKIGFSKKKS